MCKWCDENLPEHICSKAKEEIERRLKFDVLMYGNLNKASYKRMKEKFNIISRFR